MNQSWMQLTYLFGAGLCCEHGEDSCAASDVEDDLVLEKVLVVVHGVAVGQSPHLVLQHLLVDAEVRVRVEVVVLQKKKSGNSCYMNF